MTEDSPTCWNAAVSMAELKRQLLEEYSPNCTFTDLPEDKDFPILWEARHWESNMYEFTFFGYRDAKYLLSLKGIHIA